jgi:Mn-dependent DtxR family transcriptional regulator
LLEIYDAEALEVLLKELMVVDEKSVDGKSPRWAEMVSQDLMEDFGAAMSHQN